MTNRRVLLLLPLAIGLVALGSTVARAANPSSGTATASGPPVTWVGTATATGSNGEATCQEGINCETFLLTLGGAPADYAGGQVSVKIAWTVPANDYDLYVHKDSVNGTLVGSSTNGAPGTSEEVALDPATVGVGVFAVHVVYFAVAPGDQYKGTASFQPKPTTRTANYLAGGMTFSPSVRLKAPVAARDGEPSNRTDSVGNSYIGAIRGVPAGIDLWSFDLNPRSPTYDPRMRNPNYLGQPDGFTDSDSTAVGGDGGGDIDLAVGLPDPLTGAVNNPPTLASTSLAAANISAQRSTDRGQTFMKNPLGNLTGGAPADDRQWLAFYGKDMVYLLYRTLEPAETMIQLSTDGGLTYGAARTAGAIGQVGAIDVDQNDGTVYISGSTGQVCAGVPILAPVFQPPTTYRCAVAASDPNGVGHLFFIVKVGGDGTVYATYSNDHDIFLVHSTDKAATWSAPVRVSNGPQTVTNVFPHLGTGKVPNSVGITWYGTPSPTNDDNADWRVFYAYTSNATAATPTFRQVEASDHVIHSSNISEGGLTGSANRNLIDYFQVSYDPVGAAVLAFADDHNDFDGHTYVTRQLSGPSIKGGRVPAPVEGSALPPASRPASAPQVVDFAQDVEAGLLLTVPQNDPLDILSITYSCEDDYAGTPGSNPMLVTRMVVSDLSTVPAASNWRSSFAANAPDSVLSPTGDFTFARSDRGDQFFFRAATDPQQASIYTYGTAVRASTGSITYTTIGAADAGSFDPATNTVTVKVALSKLNAALPAGHASIANGAVLAGLRGQAYTSNANAKRDITRGGTQYTVQCGPRPAATPAGAPGTGKPGDGIDATDGEGAVSGGAFEVEAENGAGGTLHYKDAAGHFKMDSDTVDSFTQTAANELTLGGLGHVGRTSVRWTARLQSNGGTGKDFFSITIPGYPSASGTLTRGHIDFDR